MKKRKKIVSRLDDGIWSRIGQMWSDILKTRVHVQNMRGGYTWIRLSFFKIKQMQKSFVSSWYVLTGLSRNVSGVEKSFINAQQGIPAILFKPKDYGGRLS